MSAVTRLSSNSLETSRENSESRVLRYLDLSGYAFTGKHAMIDLVREFRGYCVPHFQFEFNLIRVQGGVRDLETALVQDWSPIRSDAAVQRFLHVVRRLAPRTFWLSPSTWFKGCGWNYDDYFNGHFLKISEEYIRALVKAKWRREWPYAALDIPAPELFCRRLLRLCGARNAFDFDYYLAAPDDFLERTRDYFQQLLHAFANVGSHTVVMHNSLEPFNPGRALRYFHDARCIIVDRDPRDVYVSEQRYVPPGSTAAPAPYRPSAVAPDLFVERFRLYRKAATPVEEDAERVLRLRFEHLVLHYTEYLQKILEFLGETAAVHVQPQRYFQPAVSLQNIGLWKTYPDQAAIRLIARELAEYCFEL